MKKTLALLTALAFAAAAEAHQTNVGALQIIHAHIAAPAEGAQSAAAYMDILNTGPTAERLLGVEVGFASAALSGTVVDANGVASMGPLEAVDLPPGSSVALEPGGLHVMLMGLTRALAVGDELPGTLVFEHQGRVEVEFVVDAPGAMGD
ncbi:copper chaperone PCu(A)C [Rhodobacter ferrooxidans]|nr:copper chaperone PCu(A)C [Rhodobacter sp. SW2]